MTVQERFAVATRRVATLSSVARNRLSEAERAGARGDDAETADRLAEVVTRLEGLADEMEKALA